MYFGESQRGKWDPCVHGWGEGIRIVGEGFLEVVMFAMQME